MIVSSTLPIFGQTLPRQLYNIACIKQTGGNSITSFPDGIMNMTLSYKSTLGISPRSCSVQESKTEMPLAKYECPRLLACENTLHLMGPCGLKTICITLWCTCGNFTMQIRFRSRIFGATETRKTKVGDAISWTHACCVLSSRDKLRPSDACCHVALWTFVGK